MHLFQPACVEQHQQKTMRLNAKNSFTRGREGGGHFSPSNWRVPPRQGYDGWRGGRHNRLDQHKAFGKLARVKPISQSKLNTQRNEPADVISSYPSENERNRPFLASVFGIPSALSPPPSFSRDIRQTGVERSYPPPCFPAPWKFADVREL